MRLRAICSALLMACCATASHAWGESGSPARAGFTYSVTHRQFDSGTADFDYLSFDQNYGRLYVTRDGGVEVYDTTHTELAYIGAIPGRPGRVTSRAVLVEDRNLGFTSNGESGSTTIFELGTLRVKGTYPLGEPTDAAAYDDATGHAFFFSGAGKEALVYDLRRHTILARIPLGSSPEFAVDDHAGSLYVNIPATGMIDRIDTRTNKIAASFAVDPSCQANSALEIDVSDRLLFAGCFNGVLDVISTATQKTVSTFPVGLVADGVIYDASQKIAFVAGVTNFVTAIGVNSPQSQVLLGTVKVGPATHTIAEDFRTGRVYVVSNKIGPPAMPGGFPTFIPETMHIETLSR